MAEPTVQLRFIPGNKRKPTVAQVLRESARLHWIASKARHAGTAKLRIVK